jgi:hypothetical protein
MRISGIKFHFRKKTEWQGVPRKRAGTITAPARENT